MYNWEDPNTPGVTEASFRTDWCASLCRIYNSRQVDKYDNQARYQSRVCHGIRVDTTVRSNLPDWCCLMRKFPKFPGLTTWSGHSATGIRWYLAPSSWFYGGFGTTTCADARPGAVGIETEGQCETVAKAAAYPDGFGAGRLGNNDPFRYTVMTTGTCSKSSEKCFLFMEENKMQFYWDENAPCVARPDADITNILCQTGGGNAIADWSTAPAQGNSAALYPFNAIPARDPPFVQHDLVLPGFEDKGRGFCRQFNGDALRDINVVTAHFLEDGLYACLRKCAHTTNCVAYWINGDDNRNYQTNGNINYAFRCYYWTSTGSMTPLVQARTDTNTYTLLDDFNSEAARCYARPDAQSMATVTVPAPAAAGASVTVPTVADRHIHHLEVWVSRSYAQWGTRAASIEIEDGAVDGGIRLARLTEDVGTYQQDHAEGRFVFLRAFTDDLSLIHI